MEIPLLNTFSVYCKTNNINKLYIQHISIKNIALDFSHKYIFIVSFHDCTTAHSSQKNDTSIWKVTVVIPSMLGMSLIW